MTSGRSLSRAAQALAVLAAASAVAPFLLVSVPPLIDYPNHLARYWLLITSFADPAVSQIYAADWRLVTNVGGDLLAMAFGSVMSAQSAGLLCAFLAMSLPPLGVLLLNRRIFGALNWWAFAFGLLLWNQVYLAGFVNLELGLGLAAFAAALDPQRASPMAAFLVRALAAAALVAMHAFAALFYIALLAGLAIGESWPRRDAYAARLRAIAIGAAPVIVVVAIMLALAPKLPSSHELIGKGTLLDDVTHNLEVLFGREKLKGAVFGFMSYHVWLDAIFWLSVPLLLLCARAKGKIRLHAGLLFVSCGLALCYVLFPAQMVGTGWVDKRFAVMAPMTALAAIRPELPPSWSRMAAAVLCAVVLARNLVVADIWRETERDVHAVRRATAPVEAGAKVIVFERQSEQGERPAGRYIASGENAFRHLGALLVPWRRAFVPTLFAVPGKQPMRVLPPYDALATTEGSALDVRALDPTSEEGTIAPAYLRRIDAFDYVLVLNNRTSDEKQPPALDIADAVLVRDEGFAALYKLEPAAALTKPQQEGGK